MFFLYCFEAISIDRMNLLLDETAYFANALELVKLFVVKLLLDVVNKLFLLALFIFNSIFQ